MLGTGVPAKRVVPAFGELEDGPPHLDGGLETVAVDQLALELGEEALGHGVVVALVNRAHRRAHPRLAAALAEATEVYCVP